MNYKAATQIHDVYRLLTQFIREERQINQARLRARRLTGIQGRETRAATHRVLASLVPHHRALDKLLMQPQVGGAFKMAAPALATALVRDFIAGAWVEKRFPDDHPVWALQVSAPQLTALVGFVPGLDSGWLAHRSDWLARHEASYPGLKQVLGGDAVGLRALRTAYLASAKAAAAQEKIRLRAILSRVEATLPQGDYALLVSYLKVKP